MKIFSKYTISLILVFTIFIGSVIYWQSLNRTYFDYDSLRHYLTSIRLIDGYRQGFGDLAPKLRQYFELAKHPPGAPVITSLFYFLITPTQKNAVLINDAIFLIILLLSLHGLARLVQDEKLGLLSCILVLFYPVVFNQAKVYMLDLPLLSIVSLTIYLLIRAEYFANRKYTVFFIMSYFLGMLIKPNFLFFTIGPLLYVIFKSISGKKARAGYLLTVGMVFIILSSVYFLTLPVYGRILFKSFIGHLMDSSQVATWTPADLLGPPFLVQKIRSLFWYIWGFINWQAGFLFFILFLWGLFVFLRSKNPYKEMIIVWLFSSYFILGWFIHAIDIDMEVTGIRYSMPLLGAVALISSYGLLNISRVILRRVAVAGVLIFGTLNAAFLSFPLLKDPFTLKIDLSQDRYHILPSYISILSTKPLIISGSSWTSHPQDKGMVYRDIEDAFFFINKFYNGREIKVLLLSDNADWWHLKYLAYLHNRDIIFFCDYSRLLRQFRGAISVSVAREADFAIEIEDEFTEPHMKRVEAFFKRLFEEEKDKFYLIREGLSYKIFKRIGAMPELLSEGINDPGDLRKKDRIYNK